MKKLIGKAKWHFPSDSHSSSSLPSSQQPPSHPSTNFESSTISPPTATDILRYRQHFGTNLGGIFVLEKWMHPSFFPPSCNGSSELDAVLHSLSTIGLPATRQKWDTHHASALTHSSLQWFATIAHGTSIRLPLGYWILTPHLQNLPHTRVYTHPFTPIQEVYQHSWPIIKSHLHLCSTVGIGVLLDLHALPGGANPSPHSGTSSSQAQFWAQKNYQSIAIDVLSFLAREITSENLASVIGIQICNEAAWEAGDKGMYAFYSEAINQISEIDGQLPVYISDAWDLEAAVEWCRKRGWRNGIIGNGNGKGKGNGMGKGGNPVVIDTHRYYTFSESDRAQSPREIIHRLPGELNKIPRRDGTATHLANGEGPIEVVVGEWSCVLDGQTWAKVDGEEKERLVREFGVAQCARWEESTAGSFFWSWKMEGGDGGGWGLVDQVGRGNVRAPAYMRLPAGEVRRKMEEAERSREDVGRVAKGDHERYWRSVSAGKEFWFEGFGEGWDTGWEDARSFFGSRIDGKLVNAGSGQSSEEWKGVREGADKIGLLEIWVRKRLMECGGRREFLWEWEQGIRSGIRAFEECVGI